jgi:hypothetical protein
MARCEVCGNDYDKSFELIAAGARHTFDSFECAIQAIAPICEHCKCRVIGHGVEVSGHFFCCAQPRPMLRIVRHRRLALDWNSCSRLSSLSPCIPDWQVLFLFSTP